MPVHAPSFPSRTTGFLSQASSGVHHRHDSKPAPKLALAALLAVALVGGIAVVVQQTIFAPNTITAYFTKTVAIYPGDEVRIAGVKVGTIDSIEPIGTQAKMTLRVDRGFPFPPTPRQ